MKQFLDEIDFLVASALTSGDSGEQIKFIEKALQKVCQFLVQLNRDIDGFIADTLSQSPIGFEGVALRLRDYVSRHEEFVIFQNSDELRKFLLVTSEVLVKQGYFSRERINEIIQETRFAHEQMLEESVSVEEFAEKFQMLKRFFCRPPEGPLDGGKKSGDGGGGGVAKESRSEKVCRYIQTAAALLALLGVLTGSPTTPQPSRIPPSSPLVIPPQMRLFALLRMAAFVTYLNNQEKIPTVQEYDSIARCAQTA